MSTKANSSSLIANDRFDTKQMPGAWDHVNKDAPSDEDSLIPDMRMSLRANKISTKHNILASLCSWLMPAGTLTLVKDSGILSNSKAERVVQNTVQNVSLLELAAVLCVAGTAGMYWLWWIWRQNYVWLIRQIFL
jgi:hypothetical protein